MVSRDRPFLFSLSLVSLLKIPERPGLILARPLAVEELEDGWESANSMSKTTYLGDIQLFTVR